MEAGHMWHLDRVRKPRKTLLLLLDWFGLSLEGVLDSPCHTVMKDIRHAEVLMWKVCFGQSSMPTVTQKL